MAERLHSSTRRLDDLPSHDIRHVIVATFDEHVRQYFPDKRLDAGLWEDRQEVDVLKCTQEGGAILLRDQRPTGPLYPGYAGVAVQAHQQQVTQGSGLLQILHVPAVQHIEAAVGEDQPLVVTFPLGATGQQTGAGKQLVLVHGHTALTQRPPAADEPREAMLMNTGVDDGI